MLYNVIDHRNVATKIFYKTKEIMIFMTFEYGSITIHDIYYQRKHII